MKKIICAGAALVASACMVACGDSSSDGSNSSSGNIVEYKSEASLPDSCRMEVALVGDTYFACFEDKWVEVTDTATINKFKEDLDESELQEILEDLEDLMAKLSSTSGKKGKSSSSEAKDDDEVESSDSEEPESSSDEEECTSRKCKNSSSSAEGDSPSSSSEGQSEEDSSSSSGGQQGDDDANKCSGKTYDPATQYCQNGTTIADLATCGTAKYNPEEKFCADEYLSSVFDLCDGKSYDVGKFEVCVSGAVKQYE
ncbi:MAG: hypothetical protein IJ909_07000, partial [Fibrobacter sp.]|nr:hypothetical protein [Fibrobacter sp.]